MQELFYHQTSCTEGTQAKGQRLLLFLGCPGGNDGNCPGWGVAISGLLLDRGTAIMSLLLQPPL